MPLGVTQLVGFGAQRQAFTPVSIPGMMYWFDSRTGVTFNGPDVAEWADQSSEGRDLKQVVASNQPVYNSSDADFNNTPSIEFDGVNEYMLTDAFTAVSQPYTLLVCFKRLSSSFGYLFDGIHVDNEMGLSWAGLPPRQWRMHAPFTAVSTIASSNSVKIMLLTWDGANSEMFVDGGSDGQAISPGTHSITGLLLGGRYTTTSNANVKFAQVIAYEGALTTEQKNNLGNYFAGIIGSSWTDIT